MSDAFLAARSRVALDKPYLGTALWAIKFIEVEKFAEKYKQAGDVAVDKHWRLYFDPEVVEAWSIEERMGALIHELCHLLRRHNRRAEMHGVETMNAVLWNVCCDAEINDDLIEDRKLKLPGDYITPQKLNMHSDLTAEEYYDDAPGYEVRCNCGSGAHGVCQPWEQKESEGRAKIEQHEAEMIARATAERILEEKSKGDIPDDWVRWAEQYSSSKVDWRRELATAIRNAAGDVRGLVDYTYRVPSRRQSAYGNIIMPAMVKPQPKVGIVGDSSGSMDQDDISMVYSESDGVLKALGIPATWYCTDAAVHVVQRIRSAKQMEFKGGGGTDMGVGIERAIEDKPDIIIVITDGYTGWPKKPPPCKLIACIVNEEQKGPSYAKTINIPPKKGR